MKSRILALVPALAASWIAFGTPAKAFEFNGSWATAPSACGQVFIKKDGAISFRQDSDQYGGGFIMEGDKVRGQMQTCTINRRKEDGNVIHMVVDENTIARIFPGMPEFTLSYSRCPM
jgi:hypothetical protein